MAATTKAKSQELPLQAYAVLSILLVIATAAVCYLVFYQPAVEKCERAQKTLIAKEDELDTLKQQEAEYQEYQKESQRLEGRLSILQAKIPSSTNELNHFLGSINQRARSSRIAKWTLFKQEGNISKGEVDAIPIRMEFQATYEATIQFFWELASMGDGMKTTNKEQLINIHEVSITQDSSSKVDPTTTMVKVLCVAETYLYTGGNGGGK
jgi:Tfp pilus assembly protein PilO